MVGRLPLLSLVGLESYILPSPFRMGRTRYSKSRNTYPPGGMRAGVGALPELMGARNQVVLSSGEEAGG